MSGRIRMSALGLVSGKVGVEASRIPRATVSCWLVSKFIGSPSMRRVFLTPSFLSPQFLAYELQ